jgi:hypothetical protein
MTEPCPGPTGPPRRRVLGYVHALNPIQRAYELKSLADFCRDQHYDLVHSIEDPCVQHAAVDCPAFLELIEYLTRDRVDLVIPHLDHLSTDPLMISLRLDRIDATTRQIFIVPNEHARFRETGA